MVPLRSALWPLLENPLASGFRHGLTLQMARREERGPALSADHRKVKLLGESDLVAPLTLGQPSELFILGSGPSVLSLTQQQLERMRAGTTIGLNSWALHDFIPDAYSFEEMEDDRYVPVAQGLSAAIARQEVITSRPLILHLRSRRSTPSSRLVSLPRVLQPNMRYYGRISVQTKQSQNLVGDLAALFRAQRAGSVSPHLLIDCGVSVARMVSIGILRGYRSIVLVGIDFNSSRYFFEEEPS